jgi:3-oxoadipate enol-lactonase
MDLRGHGRGIPSGPRYRLADCADDAAALADALDVDTFIPVGYSLGGPIAQLVWHRHRDRVDGLVLCATSRNFGGKLSERLFFKTMWAPVAAIRARRLVPSPRRPQPHHDALPAQQPHDIEITNLSSWALREMRRSNPTAIIGAMHALGRFSSHEWVGEIDVPTAVVVTVRDQLVNPSRQYKLALAIPGATIHEAHTDHLGCVLGAGAFIPVLLDACASVADRADPSGVSRP